MQRSRFHLPATGILLCALLLCLGFGARAATVHLLSGESYTGKVQFVNNQVVVMGQSGTNAFDLSAVLDATFRDDGDPKKAGLFPAGVLLTDGSLVGGPINQFSDPIKVGSATIPMASVAWVVFQPIARDKIPKPASGETGAILPSGDFFPGPISGIQDDSVAINSTLFGPQRFSIRGRVDISALVLRDVVDTGARYEVFTRTGSVYTVSDVKSESDNIGVHDAILGDVKINKDDLYEIRLTGNQYQYLVNIKPDRVDPPTGVDPATAVQVPQDASGAAGENLQTAVNTAVTYTIPKGSATFSSGASVPQGAPPGARYTFAVYGDGKFLITKTPAIAAGDAEQHISVLVSNLHTITIRIEPASVGTGTFSALWIQPMFLGR